MPCQMNGPCYQHLSGGPGRLGIVGNSVTTLPPTASKGEDGRLVGASVSNHAFVSLLDPYYTSIVLHEAEGYYINGDIRNAVSRLIWLKGLLDARVQAVGTSSTDAEIAFAAHRHRVNTLLNQMALSLDYYGQFLNSVPLLTVEAIIGELDGLIAYGQIIEDAYTTYASGLEAQKTDQAALATIKFKLLQQNQELLNLLDDNVKQRTGLESNVAQLTKQLQTLWSQMAQAQESFQAAVAQASGGCNFGEVVTLAAMVATMVASGGTAIAVVGPALAALNGLQKKDGKNVPIPDTFEGFKYKVNTVVAVGTDVQSFAEAASKVASSLSKATESGLLPTPPNDETKILAQAKDIDAELDKYRNLPEAQAYRALIDNYVATAQAKNNMILQVNALYVAWDNTKSQIDTNTSDARSIQDKITDNTDPRLAKAVLFTESAYRQSISGIKYALYSVNRAYNYYALDASPLSIDDTTIATLGAMKNRLIEHYYKELARFGAGAGTFNRKVDLASYLPKGALQRFIAGTAPLSFSIPTEAVEFKPASQIMVNKIGVSIKDDTKEINDFSVNFTHHGHSVMLDADGGKHIFSHVPIHVPFGVDAAGQRTFSGDFSARVYNGVSPYGPWTIDISSINATDRASIRGVTVEFDGYARGRNL